MKDKQMSVEDIVINYKRFNNDDFICLTDMAKFKNAEIPAHVISHWMSTKFAIEYMGIWEKFNNPDFNLTGFGEFRNESGGSFTLSPKQWIEKTNANGIVSNSGRYGGTYAHKDIAFEFATWLSAEFKYLMIKEFQKLKETEQSQLQWSARRELAKLNYHIQTDAIKENLIPVLNEKQKSFAYANEADVLNVVLFGKTASEWRAENKELAKNGNMRDFANIHQLLVLANLESYNANMINDGIVQSERMQKLGDMARHQLPILLSHSQVLLGDNKS